MNTATAEQVKALIDAATNLQEKIAEFKIVDDAKDESAAALEAAQILDESNQIAYETKKAEVVEASNAVSAALSAITG